MNLVLQRVKQATVALALFNEGDPKRPFNIVGSGFCVHPRGIVVTCEHVLSAFMKKPLAQAVSESGADKSAASTQFPIETTVPYAVFFLTGVSSEELIAFPIRATMGMAKTDHDLGMVKLHGHKVFAKGFPFLEIAPYAQIHEGQDVGTCGFPLGTYLYDQIGTVTSSFTKGIVSSVIPAHGVPIQYLKGFQLNLVATHGNSGGPVFVFDSGKVFGALERGVVGNDGKLLQGLSVAAPVYPAFDHDTVNRMLNAQPGKLPIG
jgi:S1-C subfamily serine protease